MAKAYDSFDDAEIKLLYRFMCMYKQNFDASVTEKNIKESFPKASNGLKQSVRIACMSHQLLTNSRMR